MKKTLLVIHLAAICGSSTFSIAMKDLCRRGHYMSNRTSTPVECTPCPVGTFNDKRNDYPKCLRCGDCLGKNNHVRRNCTATRDTKCICSPDRFWNEELAFCSMCDECGKGEGVTWPCDGRSNTKCEPCKEGITFSNSSSLSGKCLPCSKCKKGFKVATSCTKQNDTVCKAEKTNESELRSSQRTKADDTDRLRSRTKWTTEPTTTEGNPNSVAVGNYDGATNAALDINLVIAGVAGFVLVIVLVVVVLVLKKKFGRSTDNCRNTATRTTPSSDSATSISVSLHDDAEAKHSNRILGPPYGPEKYLRDVSFSLISELSRHLNPEGRWKILAGRLDFTTTDISNINIKPEESTETMLNRWGQRHDSTLNHLFEVLMSLGWKHEAGLIRKYIFLP